MRVRITRRASDDVDGISLALFQVGVVYEVSATIATYLIAMECAEPAETSAVEATEIRFGFNVALPPAIAAEQS
jgi:hypothetical protein